LIACKSSERRNIQIVLKQLPQAFSAQTSQRVFDVYGAAQLFHVFRGIRTRNAFPPQVGLPGMPQIAMIAVMSAHWCDLDCEEIELRFGIWLDRPIRELVR
jgi:hypothetical protein